MNTSLGLYPVSAELEISMLELGFPLLQNHYNNGIKAVSTRGKTLFECFIYTGNVPQVVYRTPDGPWFTCTGIF